MPSTGIAKVIGILGIALVIWFHGAGWGEKRKAIELAEVKAQHAQTLQDIAGKAAKAYEKALQRERAIADVVAEAEAVYEDKRYEIAQTARDSVLADIRAGRLRVRNDQARCPVPAAGQTAATAGERDGQADSGGQTAAAAVGIGAEADAQLEACQAVITAYTSAADTGSAKP